ncbi:MAG: hypothetical protein II453_19205 [Alphaproteobacteria bacterium]|nr:hypothetical protein [Alphaproteobacteria bacterium]
MTNEELKEREFFKSIEYIGGYPTLCQQQDIDNYKLNNCEHSFNGVEDDGNRCIMCKLVQKRCDKMPSDCTLKRIFNEGYRKGEQDTLVNVIATSK